MGALRLKEFRLGPSKVKYFFEDRDAEGKNSFIVGDVLADLPECDRVCYVTDVYTEFACRNQGYAKAAVNRFIELVSPEMPIVSAAMVMQDDYPIEPGDEVFDTELEWKGEFLKKMGFTDINKYVGYESSVAFLYVNEKTQPYIDACEARAKEFEESKKTLGENNNGI